MTLTTTNTDFESMLGDIKQMQDQCKALLQTKHYAAMGEAGIFALLQKAKSLNINPISALNGALYFVQGRVGMSTEMMATLIRRAGHSIIKDPKSDNSICILHGKRADNGDTWTCSFSLEDAKRAGLLKNMYDKYPAVMLYNRACSMLARQLYPDVIDGCGYDLAELKEIAESKSSGFTSQQPSVNPMELQVEPQPVERISSEQGSELLDILNACDPDYKAKVCAFIKLPPHNAQSVLELPVSLHAKFRSGALQKRAEWEIKSKKAESQAAEAQVESE